MLGNFLTSTIRALQRDKFHVLLNIAGLTLSLAVTFLMVLYIRYEFSYEDFFTDPDRVFLVETTFQLPADQISITANGAPHPLLDAMETTFGDQIKATYFSDSDSVITVGDRLSREEITFADANFFEVLDFPLAYGSYEGLLDQPDRLILTESMAEQLFGKTNAVGEYLQVDGENFQVAAILRDIPANTVATDLKILASAASPLFDPEEGWTNAEGAILLRVNEEIDAQNIQMQLSSLIDQFVRDDHKAVGKLSFHLVHFNRLHLLTGGWSGISNDRNLVVVFMAAVLALLLVVIACFNYINLSTARALLRTKEVGIRKILGARKTQLVTQFLGEALLTMAMSCVLALGLAALFLPGFSVLVDRQLIFADLISPQYLMLVGAGSVGIGLLSGLYPALFLASAKPKDLFENQKSSTGKRTWLRSAIVGSQFSITLCLIVVASVVFAQATHLRTLDLGFRKQGILVISGLPSGNEATLREAYSQRLADSPYIEKVGSSSSVPATDYERYTLLSRASRDSAQNRAALTVFVDDQFFDLYGIAPIAGRTYSVALGDTMLSAAGADDFTYRGPIVISESAVSYFGFESPEEATGQLLTYSMPEMIHEYEIIGVVPDIQFRLARAPIKPMAFYYRAEMDNDALEVTSALVAPGGLEGALAHAEQTWKAMFPDKPFEYEFLEDRIEEANADEQRQAQLFIYLTGLAIFVTCLGLFGLVSFVAARRTREVAIRKVLGATVGDLSRLLIWEFAKPVLIANFIAWPVAWLLMRRWLDGFDSRIELSPSFFVGASLLALIIALATVLSRIWKTAHTHPVLALKYE